MLGCVQVYIDVYAVESTYAALRADTESKATSRKTIQNSIVKERTRLMDLEEQGAGHLKVTAFLSAPSLL